MGNKSEYRKLELTIYAVIWSTVFIYPLLTLSEKVIDGGAADWTGLLRSYRNILPFFVLFLINTLLLLPRFLFKGHNRRYIISAAILLAGFVGLQYYETPTHKQPERHTGIKPPPTRPVMPDMPDMPVKPDFQPDNPSFPHEHPVPVIRPQHIISGPIVIDTIIALLLIAAGAGIKAFFNSLKQQQIIAQLENERLRNELNYLKAQLSPHFFMNILNNIHGMVELNPPKAQELILKMSQLMRYVLYDSNASMVALSKEMEFNETYILLMKSRYSRKKVVIETSFPDKDKTKDKFLPPLLYIVFLENVFKHGISYRDQSFISIAFELDGDTLTFCCLNSINSRCHDSNETGIGLRNVRKRLEMIYGDDFSLYQDETPEYYRITLTIPINENKMYSRR